MAITHFSFGAACATVLVSALFPDLRYARTLILVSGCWAMVPDLHQISPAFGMQLRMIHDSALSNLFWLHGTFDAVDPTDSRRVAAVMLGAFLLVTLLADTRLSASADRVHR